MRSGRQARPGKAEYHLDIALAVAAGPTCLRRRYGAVIAADDEIIATGCDGAARGDADCIDAGVCHRCGHWHDDGDHGPCPAVHAEMNAMSSASRPEMIGATSYSAGVDPETGERIPPDGIPPCPVRMRMIGNAGVDVVTSAWK